MWFAINQLKFKIMGASNFYYKNAGALYPLFMDRYEDDYFDYQEECQNIAEWIDEKIDAYAVLNEPDSNFNNRIYPTRVLATKWYRENFGEVTIEIKLSVVVHAGYYEGACLDYYTEMYQDGMELDTYNDISQHNSGHMTMKQLSSARKWAEKTDDEISELCEKVFSEITQPYRKIGTASNGETFYEKQ